jgi:uncharacterized protein YkwD
MKDLILLLYFVYLAGHPNIGSPIDRVVMVRGINAERAKASEPALISNMELMASAQAKCQDMLNRNYWSHFAPDGTSPWFFYEQAGYKYHYAGENLARDADSDEEAMEWLMASPTHKQNILGLEYTDIGVGKCSGKIAGVSTTLWVQHFGGQ